MCLPDYGVFTGVYDFFQKMIFGAPEGMYEHYENMPEKKILDLEPRFKQVLTTNCFYSDDYGYEPSYEFAVLDLEEKVVIFYALSKSIMRGTLLNTWRIGDYSYDDYIEDIGYNYIRHSLKRTPIILDANLAHEGTHYWQAIVSSVMGEEPTSRLVKFDSRSESKFMDSSYPFTLDDDFLDNNGTQYILLIE